jgi:GTP-binding protein EngB required for normal cell division
VTKTKFNGNWYFNREKLKRVFFGIEGKQHKRKRRRNMSDWQKRVYSERTELLSKIDKLALFVESDKFKNADIKNQELLRQQLQHMMTYYAVLSARIHEFS